MSGRFDSKNLQPANLDRPLTPAQCAQVAESLKDLPPLYQLTAAELEMIQEEVHGKPLRYGEPAAALAAMKVRLGVLLAEKRTLLDTLDEASESATKLLTENLNALNREIVTTRDRIADYLRQQGEAN